MQYIKEFKKVIVIDVKGLSKEVVNMIDKPMYYLGNYKESNDTFADLRNSKGQIVRIFHYRLINY